MGVFQTSKEKKIKIRYISNNAAVFVVVFFLGGVGLSFYLFLKKIICLFLLLLFLD